MTTVVVTGAAGKAGRAVTADLRAHAYDVLATDVVLRPSSLAEPYLRADLVDYGQALEVLSGADAVVHLANIPAPGISTDATTLDANLAMNSHVFLAARQLGMRKVVWASSETTLGLPFGPNRPPRYVPVDEAHFPYPTSTYALSKVLTEVMAEQVSTWTGIPFVGLRFSNLFTEADYEAVESFRHDPLSRIWNVWGYIDARDAAASCRNALEADTTGSVNLVIANDDTIVDAPSEELMSRFLPDVPVRGHLAGHQTLLSNELAKQVIGFAPAHGWRG
jgi:nucleoside-diphosphate-sugar epimerase